MSTDYRDHMRVDWPKSTHGTAALARFTVTPEDAEWQRLRAMMSGRGCTAPGIYTELRINGRLWMSDTPDEMTDHLPFLYHAARQQASRILVNGLGLGMVARALAVMPHVTHIDVCDINADVVGLVGPHLQEWGDDHGTTINLIVGDAHEPAKLYAPGTRWDLVWSDIWQHICADNWESMKTMRRRYGRRCDYHGLWSEPLVRRAVEQSRRQEKAYAMWRR